MFRPTKTVGGVEIMTVDGQTKIWLYVLRANIEKQNSEIHIYGNCLIPHLRDMCNVRMNILMFLSSKLSSWDIMG